jgi:hypothetical protein
LTESGRLAFTGFLILAAARAAAAQTCSGALSFNFAPLQVGGASGWTGGGATAAASVAAGSDRLFGSLSTGLAFTGADRGPVAHATVAVGTDQPMTLDNRLHVCPVATVSYARGQGRASAGAGGHVTFGWIAHNAAGLIVVPSAGLGVRPVPGSSASPDPPTHAGELQAAVGLILRGRLAVTPRVTLARRQRARLAVELAIHAR